MNQSHLELLVRLERSRSAVYTTSMNLPFTLPDWAPWWAQLLILLPALLYALAFLFMPFSVIGVKTRLEALEMRLEDLQNEIRQLSLRLPAGTQGLDFEEVYAPQPARPPQLEPVVVRPAIPAPRSGPAPKSGTAQDDDRVEDRAPPPPHTRPIRRAEPPARSEPRLDSQR